VQILFFVWDDKKIAEKRDEIGFLLCFGLSHIPNVKLPLTRNIILLFLLALNIEQTWMLGLCDYYIICHSFWKVTKYEYEL